MRQREKRSKRAAKPSSASGGSSTEPWPTAWKKPAIGSSLSRVCRRANGAAFAPRMQSNGYTRNSSAGSRRRPCCRRQTPPPCCSGRCSLPVRSTCARSMDGKPLLQNPSISQLTSQLDPIPSVTRRLRRAKFQPHHGRHRRYGESGDIGKSGAKYTYYVYARHPNINEGQDGNYIYAKKNRDGLWLPVYIGQGDLSKRATADHHRIRCIDLKLATHVH